MANPAPARGHRLPMTGVCREYRDPEIWVIAAGEPGKLYRLCSVPPRGASLIFLVLTLMQGALCAEKMRKIVTEVRKTRVYLSAVVEKSAVSAMKNYNIWLSLESTYMLLVSLCT